ncbi:hypothetical protein FB389_0080 [Rarobacter incanus]|uniref:Uncharacterized protein n=1 Tax=Rarobacter incanus TaxID=153494 RepID=A0A542SLE9_9MICO|nr:hypothetical protein FB389_0080 [Rarobacter incanus]
MALSRVDHSRVKPYQSLLSGCRAQRRRSNAPSPTDRMRHPPPIECAIPHRSNAPSPTDRMRHPPPIECAEGAYRDQDKIAPASVQLTPLDWAHGLDTPAPRATRPTQAGNSTNASGQLDQRKRATRPTQAGNSTNASGQLDQRKRATRPTQAGNSTNASGQLDQRKRATRPTQAGWEPPTGDSHPARAATVYFRFTVTRADFDDATFFASAAMNLALSLSFFFDEYFLASLTVTLPFFRRAVFTAFLPT